MLLIQSLMSLQYGAYLPMVDGSARIGGGHIQIQHHLYLDDPRIDHHVPDVSVLLSAMDTLDTIEAATARVESFALLAHGEESTGVLVQGVMRDREMVVSDLPGHLSQGEYLTEGDHAYVGAALARNLDLEVNSELVILGSDPDGSVAATVVRVGGIFDTGIAILDRAIVQIPLETMQSVFALSDSAHRMVIMVNDGLRLEEAVADLQKLIPTDMSVRDWKELSPDVEQSIRLDKLSNSVIYVVLTIIIVSSIANTFVMTMFERTREFGILQAVGVRPATIFRMLMTEAAFLWLIGMVAGLVVSGVAIAVLMLHGVPIPFEGMDVQFSMPERIYGTINYLVVVYAPVALGIGVLLSACIAFLRLYRLQVVEALRDEE